MPGVNIPDLLIEISKTIMVVSNEKSFSQYTVNALKAFNKAKMEAMTDNQKEIVDKILSAKGIKNEG